MKNYRLGIILSLIVVAVIVGGGVYIYTGAEKGNKTQKDTGKKEKKKDKKGDSDADENETSSTCFGGKLVAEQTWELPNDLVEVSGIAWMGQEKVAAVQDNEGFIFIYNLSSKKVEQKINFGAKGDYEGLTYTNGHFFVMRADGYILEIDQKGKVLNQHDLPLTVTDNIESFYFDAAKNRMLIGQKDGKKGSITKNVYAFDLASRKFNSSPVYSIDLSDPVVSCGTADSGKKKGKEGKSTIRPSEIAIHPQTKEIYIADGPNQRILVLAANGKPKYYLAVDKKAFPQIEGLMFSPAGDLYVSTEGIKEPANISKMGIELN